MMMMMMMMMMNTNAMPALEGKVIFLGPFSPRIVEISPFPPMATDDVLREISRFGSRILSYRRKEVFLLE